MSIPMSLKATVPCSYFLWPCHRRHHRYSRHGQSAREPTLFSRTSAR